MNTPHTLFDDEWKRLDYVRTNWIPCEDNRDRINDCFGDKISRAKDYNFM